MSALVNAEDVVSMAMNGGICGLTGKLGWEGFYIGNYRKFMIRSVKCLGRVAWFHGNQLLHKNTVRAWRHNRTEGKMARDYTVNG